VAEEFRVSDVAVGKAARRERWHRRVRSKDIAADRKMMRQAIRVRVQEILDSVES
jgi:hypothetical protein